MSTIAPSAVQQHWPTAEELDDVLAAVSRLSRPLEELEAQLGRLVDPECAPSRVEGAPAATLADLGALASFSAALSFEAEYLADQAAKIERSVRAAALDVAENTQLAHRRRP